MRPLRVKRDGERGAGSQLFDTLGQLRRLQSAYKIIATPWREDLCFCIAGVLEREGIARFIAAGERSS